MSPMLIEMLFLKGTRYFTLKYPELIKIWQSNLKEKKYAITRARPLRKRKPRKFRSPMRILYDDAPKTNNTNITPKYNVTEKLDLKASTVFNIRIE
jgi:hypothetical protein